MCIVVMPSVIVNVSCNLYRLNFKGAGESSLSPFTYHFENIYSDR